MALAAVVILGVGTATTLAVVRPWESDPADADVSAEPQDSEQAEPSDLPGSTPTSPPPTSAPTQPPLDVPTTGDLDGDGLGDAVAVFGRADDVQRLVLSSTGMSFEVSRSSLADFEDRTWADFDGDGTLDQVSWTYQLGGTLTLTSDDLDFGEMDLPFRLANDKAPYVTLKPGDFDGDGAVDLVAYGESGPREVSLWVLRNNGDGFDGPAVWDRLRNATYADTNVLAADLTGDDRADVLVRRGEGAARGFALLASTGDGFLAGRPDRPSPFVDVADVVIGDFSGDGTPIVLLVGARRGGVRIEGFRMVGTDVDPDHRWDANIDGTGSPVSDSVVSDVDGDGDDDVVFATSGGNGRSLEGFRVLRSTGSRLEAAGIWAETPRCSSRDCVFYFQNSY